MPDHEEPVPEEPDSYPITVRFHYHRPNGDYEGWNGWIWDNDGISQVNPPYDLVEENGEMIATVKLKPGTCQVGYIFRLGMWVDRDIYEDQFVDITGIISGTVDVYVESGVKGHTVVLADDVISGYIPMTGRILPNREQIMVRMSSAMTDRVVDENTFEVYCNGEKLAVTKIMNVNQYYYLNVSEELVPGIYTVSIDGIDISINFDGI
jgi:pullulanase